MKKRGEERREWMGFETKDSVGWCHRGIRARMFKPTSSGTDGIKGCCCCCCWDSVALAVDMVRRRVCLSGWEKGCGGVELSVILCNYFGMRDFFFSFFFCGGLLGKENCFVCCANLGPIFNY